MPNELNSLLPIPDDLLKPQVFQVSDNINWVNPGIHFKKITGLLRGGNIVCMTGTYGFALAFYSWLRKQNDIRFPVKDYQSSRKNRENFRLLNANLMIEISKHQAALEKAPLNPWLREFYKNPNDYLIRFADFLGMNGAWQWHSNGIRFPLLEKLVHPYYGVYFPTRHEHLVLFDNWLSKNKGFTRALDIGTGCGVLALTMTKHGIPFVHATDTNPNAVFSAKCEMLKHAVQERTIVEQASFTGSFKPQANDLIVFNPPWIPAHTDTEMDTATYYEPGFFEGFFEHVYTSSPSGTTLVMLFSNFARVAGISNDHPVEYEIQNNKRFLFADKLEMQMKQPPSSRKNWLSGIRSREKVELWVLKTNSIT